MGRIEETHRDQYPGRRSAGFADPGSNPLHSAAPAWPAHQPLTPVAVYRTGRACLLSSSITPTSRRLRQRGAAVNIPMIRAGLAGSLGGRTQSPVPAPQDFTGMCVVSCDYPGTNIRGNLFCLGRAPGFIADAVSIIGSWSGSQLQLNSEGRKVSAPQTGVFQRPPYSILHSV